MEATAIKPPANYGVVKRWLFNLGVKAYRRPEGSLSRKLYDGVATAAGVPLYLLIPDYDLGGIRHNIIQNLYRLHETKNPWDCNFWSSWGDLKDHVTLKTFSAGVSCVAVMLFASCVSPILAGLSGADGIDLFKLVSFMAAFRYSAQINIGSEKLINSLVRDLGKVDTAKLAVKMNEIYSVPFDFKNNLLSEMERQGIVGQNYAIIRGVPARLF